jgi:hypothetical protein
MNGVRPLHARRPAGRLAAPSRHSAWRFAALLALVALVLAMPGIASAKSYTMGPVAIESQVAADGSMSVVEDRTFEFTDDYTFVYWDLRKKGGASLGSLVGASMAAEATK